MKKLFLASVLSILTLGFLSTEARASTDVNIMLSSAVTSGVIVTTGTVIRVDNWNKGIQVGTTTILQPRVAIFIQNLDGTNAIFCDYETNFSITTTDTNVGLRVTAGNDLTVGIWAGIAYYCQAVDAAGISGLPIHVEQLGRR